MSIYGWAWRGDRHLPDKPLDRMSMDEVLRGLCLQTLGDVDRCRACGGRCVYGLRVLAMADSGISPVPFKRPDPDWKMAHKAKVQRIQKNIEKQSREQLKAERRERALKARELMAQGMAMEDAAKAVGYSNKHSLKVALRTALEEEKRMKGD